MLIVKYSKTGPARYASHVDTLRTMGRVFARAGIKVNYSEGFNPHALMYFSPPNAVGVDSLCEYVAVSSPDGAKGIADRFDKGAPEGFKALRVWETPSNPNLAGVIDSASYVIESKGIGCVDYDKIREEFVISYRDKEGVKTKDYSSYVLSAISLSPDKVDVTLRYGNQNLRPDRFVAGVKALFGLPDGDDKIIKTCVYIGGVPVDEFLYNLTR